MAIEDFTTYTEVDTSSTITITSTKIDVAAIPESDDDFVYSDKTADHFDGDFTHQVEVYLNSTTANGIHASIWALSNSITAVSTDIGTGISCRAYDEGELRLTASHSGAQDVVTGLSLNTLYYLEIERDEAVGTYGTLYVRIYSDSDRTILVDTATQALQTALYDYRYVYGFMNYGNEAGSYTWTGYSQNLDLQEGAAGPANVKSWNGLAAASIKSINGVAIASVKSVNGLA